jgi:hypothetical protein
MSYFAKTLTWCFYEMCRILEYVVTCIDDRGLIEMLGVQSLADVYYCAPLKRSGSTKV